MTATETVAAPDDQSRPTVGRRLAVTWQHPVSRDISPVGLLEYDGHHYRFDYIRNAETTPDFVPLLGFPDLHRAYESPHLFPLFAQRVMDPRRPDHARYVRRLGLPADATPWEQMSRSGGGRQGDVLQLFPEPQVQADGRVACDFLVHGIRHVPDRPLVLEGRERIVDVANLETHLAALRHGDPLQLVREPQNPANAQAVMAVTAGGFPLGWVPNLLLDDLYEFCGGEPETADVVVQQVNGPDAPSHLRLLARLTTESSSGYQPFTGASWEKLAESLS
ncbi:hypothetical protein O2W15_19620 [Modestobacter sp. VKM Ac-2979]|uniref:hypothetical protein n=1 Tax=unclassified Modestobacter TaxID=2643866 RepID=UPI0022AB6E16|nr:MULTISPECIES: hypothetical protein [unclassified Modestobacter]MCZ2813643.1 hypothetical protein [Modestobacter sp. VKM Ac-2979]MCZ2842165.1 hypothetical protein [Modestobacter sp. VKM Ac-2980]